MRSNRPWPVISEYLETKYNIVGQLDLMEYGYSVVTMYNQLKSFYKDAYKHNDRILIYHYDTDFYIDRTGTTLYNLLTCLSDLNIPLEFCILLTNHYGISQEIENSPVLNTSTSKSLTIFESNYTILQSTPQAVETDIDADLIRYPYICLQGSRRYHRLLFSCGLKDRGLLDKGLVSWHKSILFYPCDDQPVNHDFEVPSYLRFITVTPFSRVNDKWQLDQKSLDLYQKHHDAFDVDFKHAEIDNEPNVDNFQIQAIKKCFLYVSAETVFDYPYPYLTEKTFKVFLYKRPFVLLGAKNSLRQLHQMGFKTFHELWDESYDQINDPNQRLLKVLDIVDNICSYSIDDLKSMCYAIKDILDYNLTHYIQNYAKSDLHAKLEKI